MLSLEPGLNMFLSVAQASLYGTNGWCGMIRGVLAGLLEKGLAEGSEA